jgi:hypothetical protein
LGPARDVISAFCASVSWVSSTEEGRNIRVLSGRLFHKLRTINKKSSASQLKAESRKWALSNETSMSSPLSWVSSTEEGRNIRVLSGRLFHEFGFAGRASRSVYCAPSTRNQAHHSSRRKAGNGPYQTRRACPVRYKSVSWVSSTEEGRNIRVLSGRLFHEFGFAGRASRKAEITSRAGPKRTLYQNTRLLDPHAAAAADAANAVPCGSNSLVFW